jgi:hypothetical protein
MRSGSSGKSGILPHRLDGFPRLPYNLHVRPLANKFIENGECLGACLRPRENFIGGTMRSVSKKRDRVLAFQAALERSATKIKPLRAPTIK